MTEFSKPDKSAAELSPVKRALHEIRTLRARLAAAEAARPQHGAGLQAPIAIVGIGLRFPGGVRDADSFWQLLINGVDAITEVPRERWDARQYLDRNPDAPGAMYTAHGGFLDRIDAFDAEFFGIAPREAAMLDPQQRLLHEVAWHALEDAGIAADTLRDTRAGIFIGLSNLDYSRAALEDDLRIDAYVGSGNSPSMAAGRLAYTLGLHGPALTLDTSCSSSLVAVHQAAASLNNGESDLALAGGVNVILAPQMHIGFSRARMLAPDGHCKTFDAAADGYVRSEGCGVVVLKRLADAERAGDRILAVIRGSAINHDGRSGGLTAPSSRAQAALIKEAHARAGITPSAIDMIEAHGTGTSLGDPIEMEALGQVFRSRAAGLPPVAVGSVKTNLGHCEAASGIVGLLKVVLALQKQIVPAHLHLTTPSSLIPWSDLPFVVPTEPRPWPLHEGQARRAAGVSSFGFSGTNAHVVLEEYPSPPGPGAEPASERGGQLILLSARNTASLTEAQKHLAEWLTAHPEASLATIARTLALGRVHFAVRAAWTVLSVDELRDRLRMEDSADASAIADPAQETTLAAPSSDADIEMLKRAALLWTQGAALDRDAWARWFQQQSAHPIALPGYAFQRRRFWLEQTGPTPAEISTVLATAIAEQARLVPCVPGNLLSGEEATAHTIRIAAAAIAARAHLGARTAMGFRRRLRILEVGAGTGAATAAVVAQLSAGAVLYTLSDVSEFVLSGAYKRFDHLAATAAMEFLRFDLNHDDDATAHAGRYDVVFLSTPLNGAGDLTVVLRRLHQLLQPGGTLVLLATTDALVQHDPSTGLTDGWAAALVQAGFSGFSAAPSPELPTAALGVRVLLAHRSAEDVDAQTVYPAIAQSPHASLSIADKPYLGWEVKSGESRVQALERAVQQHAANVLGMTRGEVPAPHQQLADLGMDSLMAVVLRNELQTMIGHELSSTFVFENTTAAEIAAALDMLLWSSGVVDEEPFASERDEIQI